MGGTIISVYLLMGLMVGIPCDLKTQAEKNVVKRIFFYLVEKYGILTRLLMYSLQVLIAYSWNNWKIIERISLLLQWYLNEN